MEPNSPSPTPCEISSRVSARMVGRQISPTTRAEIAKRAITNTLELNHDEIPGTSCCCSMASDFMIGKLRPQKSVAIASIRTARPCSGETVRGVDDTGGRLLFEN